MAQTDTTALEALSYQPIDWRHKGIPAALHGRSAREVGEIRPNLFTDGFTGPILTLDRAALDHNMRAMANWCAAHGVDLAPHGKTTMAPQLVAEQIAHGAWGVTVATVDQARVYRAFGVSPILIANQVADPAGLAWMAEELNADPDARLLCWVDSVAGVELANRMLETAERPLEVMVEMGAPGGRAGCRSTEDAVEVAAAVAAAPNLRLVGVAGYEGALAHDASPKSVAIVDHYVAAVRALTIVLFEQGFFGGLDEIIVTAGGSAFFDRVAAALVGDWPSGMRVRSIIRSACYLTHDQGFYAENTPASRGADAPRFVPALKVWGRVSSRPAPDLALLTLGKRDASFDEGLPIPLYRRGLSDSDTCQETRVITALNDQHAFLLLDPADDLAVGDWVGCGLSHPCAAFDRWRLIPIVDGDTVVDLVHTFF